MAPDRCDPGPDPPPLHAAQAHIHPWAGYGVNWFLGKDAAGRKMRWRSGSSVGGDSILAVYPDQKLGLAMQTNLTDPEMEGLHASSQACFSTSLRRFPA